MTIPQTLSRTSQFPAGMMHCGKLSQYSTAMPSGVSSSISVRNFASLRLPAQRPSVDLAGKYGTFISKLALAHNFCGVGAKETRNPSWPSRQTVSKSGATSLPGHERRADTTKVDLRKMEGQVKLMTKADKLFREHVRKIPSIVKTRSDTKIKLRPWNPLFPSISEKKEHARFAIPKECNVG